MIQKLLGGVLGTVTLGAIALTNPEHVLSLSDNPMVKAVSAWLDTYTGGGSEAWVTGAFVFGLLFLSTLIFAILLYVVAEFIGSKRSPLNKDMLTIFKAIENGRAEIAHLDSILRRRKFGHTNAKAFDKLGHARRIIDALDHRAHRMAPYYKQITSANKEDVKTLFDKPLKFSVTCVNSLKDTQAIQVIPEIHPMEAVVKLELLFASVVKEIERSDERTGVIERPSNAESADGALSHAKAA